MSLIEEKLSEAATVEELSELQSAVNKELQALDAKLLELRRQRLKARLEALTAGLGAASSLASLITVPAPPTIDVTGTAFSPQFLLKQQEAEAKVATAAEAYQKAWAAWPPLVGSRWSSKALGEQLVVVSIRADTDLVFKTDSGKSFDSPKAGWVLAVSTGDSVPVLTGAALAGVGDAGAAASAAAADAARITALQQAKPLTEAEKMAAGTYSPAVVTAMQQRQVMAPSVVALWQAVEADIKNNATAAQLAGLEPITYTLRNTVNALAANPNYSPNVVPVYLSNLARSSFFPAHSRADVKRRLLESAPGFEAVGSEGVAFANALRGAAALF